MTKKTVKGTHADPRVAAIVERVFDQETAESVIETLVRQLGRARLELIIPGPSAACKAADVAVSAAQKRMKKLLADLVAMRPYMRPSR